MVFLDRDTLLVTNTTFAFRHQRIACIVCLTDIAVDAIPSIIAITVFAFAQRPVGIGQRTTHRFRTVETAKSWRTDTIPGGTIARGKLGTLEGVELTVETRRTFGRTVIQGRETRI